MHKILPNLLSCSLPCVRTYMDSRSTEPLWCEASHQHQLTLLVVHALGLLSKQSCPQAARQTPAPSQPCAKKRPSATRLVLPQTSSGWHLPRLAWPYQARTRASSVGRPHLKVKSSLQSAACPQRRSPTCTLHLGEANKDGEEVTLLLSFLHLGN